MKDESGRELMETKGNSSEGKLKFPRTEESDVIEAKLEDRVHVCGFCNKGFSSGKALGGHMRVHAEENRGGLNKNGRNPNKNKRGSTEKSQHLDTLSDNPTCYQCGKGFPSLKSLFGHMRCHPERDHRGIQPPQTGLNHLSPSSTVSDDETTVHPQFDGGNRILAVPTWSVKATRGRQSLIPAATSSSTGEHGLSEKEKDVVQVLMLLAQSEPREIEAMNNNSVNVGDGIGHKSGGFESKRRNIKDLGYGSECKQVGFNETVPLEAEVPDSRSKCKIKPSNSNSLNMEAEIGCKAGVLESKRRKIEDLGYGSASKKARINEIVPSESECKGKALFGSRENSLPGVEFRGKDSNGSASSNELTTANMRSDKRRIFFFVR